MFEALARLNHLGLVGIKVELQCLIKICFGFPLGFAGRNSAGQVRNIDPVVRPVIFSDQGKILKRHVSYLHSSSSHNYYYPRCL